MKSIHFISLIFAIFVGNFITGYYIAYYLETPTNSCVLSMERKAVQDPAYFKKFWERVAVKYEETK